MKQTTYGFLFIVLSFLMTLPASASSLRVSAPNTLDPQYKKVLEGIIEKAAPKAFEAKKFDNINITRGDIFDSKNARRSKKGANDNIIHGNLENGSIAMHIGTQTLTAHENLMKAYQAFRFGQYEAALKLYHLTLDEDPKEVNALFGLGALYQEMRQYDKAKEMYAHTLLIKPDHTTALNNFLSLLAHDPKERVIHEMRKLEAANPYLGVIPAQIGLTYAKKGDLKRAIRYLNKAALLEPDRIDFKYNLAVLLDQAKMHDKASKLYSQILQAAYKGAKLPVTLSHLKERLTHTSAQ